MDLIYILGGAILGIYSLSKFPGTLPKLGAVVGAAIFLYGLIKNHTKHQGK